MQSHANKLRHEGGDRPSSVPQWQLNADFGGVEFTTPVATIINQTL